MSKTSCEVCDVHCSNEFDYEVHLKSKKHIKNVEEIEKCQSLSKRSIFVADLPAHFINAENCQELINFFAKFDKIIFYKFVFRNMIVEFQNDQTVDYLLSKSIYYNNLKLNITRRIVKFERMKAKKKVDKKAPELINNTNELDYKNIGHIFKKDVSFDEQLMEFLSTISIGPDEIKTRYESTRLSLQNIFKKSLPNCKAHRFGSTITGLGFKNCDLDIYLETGLPIINKPNAPTVLKTSASIFSDVKRILYSRSHIFTDIVPISQAKTPIIKFNFKPTNVSVDLSFKNSLAVHNSILVNYLLSIDDKLRPTMMILKYWLCNHEQKGNKISKYALTLLFIFYCQQPSVQLLPTIHELKEKIKPEFVEGWQVNFKKEKINKTTLKASPSIPELLFGFFDFYANYDFQLNVVCPIDGMSHKKIILNSVETLPDSMELYKVYLKTREKALVFSLTKPMCIQDPSELNHNVTNNVDAKYLELLQKYCQQSAAICKNSANNNYKDLLSSLFELNLIVTFKASPIISFIFCANNLLQVGLPDDFDTRTDIQNKDLFVRENWIDLVIDLTQNFLEKVLKLQIQIINKNKFKQQKINTMSNVHTDDNNTVIMHCTGDICLWRDRKGHGKYLDPSLTLLEKEVNITNSIYRVLTSKNRSHNEKIDFECQILKKPVENPHIIITLNNVNTGKACFNELASYIQNKLTVILEKTLLHMKQYHKKISDINLT